MWAASGKPQLPLSPLNSRALLCADRKANTFSAAAIRRPPVPHLQAPVQGHLSGAVKGGGTELAVFIARLCVCSAVARRVSTAVLFL